MPWKARDKMSLRREFAALAALPDTNMRELCRRFGISPTTGYKWHRRYMEEGASGLEERSRKPQNSPLQVAPNVERAVVALRRKHPAWGARKLHGVLKYEGFTPLPSRSTVNRILRRHGLIEHTRAQRDLVRFERPLPNDLWQMDFKGHFQTDEGTCHPFTCLDDHSRFSIGIFACSAEDRAQVQPCLEKMFRTYGMPKAILCDNGAPWGNPSERCPVTSLGVWLWRLGIDVLHGRPYHPQTQGKLERFHRSFKAEVLNRPAWQGLIQCQRAFDRYRGTYNYRRPHESLDDARPAERYRLSQRSYPSKLPEIEYDEGVTTRRVNVAGTISYKSVFYHVGRAFKGYRLGLMPTPEDGVLEVSFGWKPIGKIDLRDTGNTTMSYRLKRWEP